MCAVCGAVEGFEPRHPLDGLQLVRSRFLVRGTIHAISHFIVLKSFVNKTLYRYQYHVLSFKCTVGFYLSPLIVFEKSVSLRSCVFNDDWDFARNVYVRFFWNLFMGITMLMSGGVPLFIWGVPPRWGSSEMPVTPTGTLTPQPCAMTSGTSSTLLGITPMTEPTALVAALVASKSVSGAKCAYLCVVRICV